MSFGCAVNVVIYDFFVDIDEDKANVFAPSSCTSSSSSSSSFRLTVSVTLPILIFKNKNTKTNECHRCLCHKSLFILVPLEMLLPDIHSYTNQCNPDVINDYRIEDLELESYFLCSLV